MSDSLEEILTEIELKKHTWDTDTGEDPVAEPAAREEKVAAFQLNLDLDGEFGEYTPPSVSESTEDTPVLEHSENVPETNEEPHHAVESPETEPVVPKPVKERAPAKKKRAIDPRARQMWGCAGGIIYILMILGVSLLLACVIIVAALDLTGLNKSSARIRFTLEEGATTATVAQTLKDKGLIDHTVFFKLYANITGDDSEYQSGVYTLSANMGYGNIMDRLRAGVPRSVVKVTVPEGYTVDDIAVLMEENAVCTKKAFYDAVLTGDYSDYSFIASLPEETGTYEGRGYALEGYLFPDTYEFYTGSTGESVVRKMLSTFDYRVDTSYKTQIAAMHMTLNDVVTLASIVQAEAGQDEWARVSRVLHNRLNDSARFPQLQCVATVDYYKSLDLSVEGLTVSEQAYDTYVRNGLTPGAICNPGMKAINAVLSPSEEEGYSLTDPRYSDGRNYQVDIEDCYFFATDYASGITYYSVDAATHQAICNNIQVE